jgi:hypothetical protein
VQKGILTFEHIERLVLLRDVCGLDADQATEVTHWTAQALLRAALEP